MILRIGGQSHELASFGGGGGNRIRVPQERNSLATSKTASGEQIVDQAGPVAQYLPKASGFFGDDVGQPETKDGEVLLGSLHQAWSHLPPNCRAAILVIADLPISNIDEGGLDRLCNAWSDLPPDLAGFD